MKKRAWIRDLLRRRKPPSQGVPILPIDPREEELLARQRAAREIREKRR